MALGCLLAANAWAVGRPIRFCRVLTVLSVLAVLGVFRGFRRFKRLGAGKRQAWTP